MEVRNSGLRPKLDLAKECIKTWGKRMGEKK